MLLLSLLAIYTMTESVRYYYAFLRSVQEHTCVYVAIKSACHADNSMFHIKLKKRRKKKRASVFQRYGCGHQTDGDGDEEICLLCKRELSPSDTAKSNKDSM